MDNKELFDELYKIYKDIDDQNYGLAKGKLHELMEKLAPANTPMDLYDNPNYMRALELLRENGTVSISALQRKLCVGYATAGRLLEMLLETGAAREVEPYKYVLNEDFKG